MLYYSKLFDVGIMAYCLMPNHFHLLLQEPEKIPPKWSWISHLLHRLQSSYATYFCRKNSNYSGHVFQGSFKIKYVDNERYFSSLIDYINNNPVRKNLVVKPEDWPYSGLSPRMSPLVGTTPTPPPSTQNYCQNTIFL
jgi:REP element-mobilizing transposase RayT